MRPGSLLDRLRCGDAIARDRLDGEYHCMRLAAPVQSGAALWGALIVVATDPHEFADGAEERLHDYADLIATAVANAEDRARSTPRRRRTRSPACPTTAPSASG